MLPFHFTFRSALNHHHHHRHVIRRTFVDTTSINWVRDRGLDHVVEREKNLRPVINIKNLIKSEPSKSLPISVLTQNRDSLMIPTRPVEFVRQYPSIFSQFLPGGVHPHLRLTPEILEIDAKEEVMYQSDAYRHQAAERLFKMLMLARCNRLPMNVIDLFGWDLGLPPDYAKTIVPEFPDYFRIVMGKYGRPDLEMVWWSDELATSVMESKAKKEKGYAKGSPIAFPMQFSMGFEMDKKLKNWIDEWQKLPYVSPYENAAHLLSQSDESDKWAVAVLHELLHILVPKKTYTENVLILGESLGIRARFKRALLHHPGIFYVSSKLRTYTVVLREGYKRGAIVDNHPLMEIRNQYTHLMNAVKEESKATSSKELKKKKKKKNNESKGVNDLKGEDGHEQEDESEDEQEGELCESSDAEVEHKDVESEDDVEEDDEEDDEEEDERMISIRKNDPHNRGREARRSNVEVRTPSRNAGRGRSSRGRAWTSESDVKAAHGNAGRGRSSRGRSWTSESDVKAAHGNAERRRSDRQYPVKRGDEESRGIFRRSQIDVRHDDRKNSRVGSKRSRSRGRSSPDKKTYV